MGHYILGVSGASGIILSFLTLKALTDAGHEVDLIMTKDASCTAIEEMGKDWNSPEKLIAGLEPENQSKVHLYRNNDFFSPVASGSAPRDGMVITPCSMATLAAVAVGLSDSLLRRAADVTMKESRRLVIVPRETPLSTIHLENMLKLSRIGVKMVMPVPAWYTHHESLRDVENFIVGRTLDALGTPANLYPRWGHPAVSC